MTNRVPVSQTVFEGIEAVRLSGLTNMIDRHAVAHLAEAMGYLESVEWLRRAPRPLRAGRLPRLRGDPMTEFHQTRMGLTFYERTLPELVRQLERLNENLERYMETHKEKQDGENVREENP